MELKNHLVPTPLLWAGTPYTRPHCAKPIQPGFERFED